MSAQLEAVLDTALEHFAHGWNALEKLNMIEYVDADAFPPNVSNKVGSAAYHFAAVAYNIKRAYEMLTDEGGTE